MASYFGGLGGGAFYKSSFFGGSTFPVQIAGLRYFLGAVRELCLVAVTDAPAGDQWRVSKNGTEYAGYLVDPSDPNASEVRLRTSDGIKAARLKT